MSNLLDKLNDKQREAVEYIEGPLLILAGAGSGKTRVITYKIAYLLEEDLVKPWEILAITFTNKAANEMKERVKSLVDNADSQSIWLGTFHSICVRILKRYIDRIGYTSDFNIFDELDKEKVIKEIIKKLNIDDKQFPVSYIKNEIGRAKEKMQDASKYSLMVAGDYRREVVSKIYEVYQTTLKQNNAIDFDDILMLTVKIFLENSDVLEYYQNKFKYIFVDEYQDTNKVQFILISLLSSMYGNICVVGDESQSIYGFRGADISNILNFEKEFPNAKIIKLEENYRSTKTILDAANSVIKNNKSKIDKKLWTQNEQGDGIAYRTLNNEYDEVEYIVDTIDTLCRKENMTYSDFAVLFRTNAQARVLEEVFMKSGTPYRLIGGLKFYARKEIKDLTSYLKLIQNPNDNVALKRIINEPRRGIGTTAVDKISELAENANMSIFEFIQNSDNLIGIRSANSIEKFTIMINELIAQKDTMPISEFMKLILKKSGYEAMLNEEATKENEARFENLMEFIGVAMEFEKENAENKLADFLDSIALVSDVDNLDDSDEVVTLMTMHSSKGLEFNVVFIAGMEEGLFPSNRSIDESDEVEEERRLCYVAITRARQKLLITNASKRTLFGSTIYSMPSRFVQEIPEELLDENSRARMEEKNYKKEQLLGRRNEYSSAQSIISRIDNSYSKVNSNTTSKSSFGLNVDSFLKNISMQKNKVVQNVSASSYDIGMRIKHKKFGVGTIQNIEQEEDDFKLEIQFETAGFKRLMGKNTPLEILD